MRVLVDMNLSPEWVPTLRESAIDAVHWRDVGPVAALDTEIMVFARVGNFAVLTRDLDFGELLALTNEVGPSVVQLRGGDPMPQASGALVIEALQKFRASLETGALVTVGLTSARVRRLPIKRSIS